jgi:hypothetical protein
LLDDSPCDSLVFILLFLSSALRPLHRYFMMKRNAVVEKQLLRCEALNKHSTKTLKNIEYSIVLG